MIAFFISWDASCQWWRVATATNTATLELGRVRTAIIWISNVFLSPRLHIYFFRSWKKKVFQTFSDTPTKEENVNTGCGTHRAQWRWFGASLASWSPRGQSRRPRSRRSRSWLPLSPSCPGHSWQSTGHWIRRWFCEICSLLGDERKIHVLAKGQEGKKGAGKDTEPRRNEAGQNRWRHLTVAGNLERSFVPVPSDVGLRVAVSHLACGDLREEGRRGSGRRAHSGNRRWWRFQLSKNSLNTNGSLLTFGLSSAVEIPVTVPSIVGWSGGAEKKVRNESRPQRPQVFWTASSTLVFCFFSTGAERFACVQMECNSRATKESAE